MHFIKLTNQVTGNPLWINGRHIVQIDEIVAGSRICLLSNVTRIVKEKPEDILNLLGFDSEGGYLGANEIQLTPV